MRGMASFWVGLEASHLGGGPIPECGYSYQLAHGLQPPRIVQRERAAILQLGMGERNASRRKRVFSGR
jgi:hypothetical protein